MADTKISELTSLTATASGDELAIVDASATETKRVSITTLFDSVPVPASFNSTLLTGGSLTVQEHIQESEQATIADDATHTFSALGAAGSGDTESSLYFLSCGLSTPFAAVFVADTNEIDGVYVGAGVQIGDTVNPDVDTDVNIWTNGAGIINVKNRTGSSQNFVLKRIGAA